MTADTEVTGGTAPPEARAPLRVSRRAPGLRRARLTGYVLWAAAFGWLIAVHGLPTDWQLLAEIAVALLFVSSIGRGWRRTVQVVLDWLPFLAVLMLYTHTRAIADTVGAPLHEADVLHVETSIFGGVEPTVWLQQHLYDPARVRWYDVVCTLVYTSHFLATPVLAAVLWLRDRRSWLRYIARVVLLSLAGLVTYIVFPEAPPWLAARDGLTAPIARLSPRGWEFLGSLHLNDTLAHAQSDGANPVAAMPSLHTAFATLVAIAIASRIRSRWRWLLALYPVAMAFTLVYTGEHYVLDLVAGVLYALVAHWVLSSWEGHRRRATTTAQPRARSLDAAGEPVRDRA